MTSAQRSVLIVGEDLSRVDVFVPLLRRLNYDVRRMPRAPAASKLVRETPLDLVVVVLPFPRARDFLVLMRAAGSPSRHAAVLLIRDSEAAPGDEALARLANRELAADASSAEYEQAVALLLDVAPRVELHTSLRMRLGGHPADLPRVVQVENLSTSGMLFTAPDPIPVGSVFGFELDLPAQKEPIRGRAQVVRHTQATAEGLQGMGASFLSLGGEGADRLKGAIFRERAGAGAQRWIDGAGAGAADLPATRAPADRAPAAPANALELAMAEEQLAELSPTLDKLLRQGLLRRLGVADWYVTGVELGLESLRAFSSILETVCRGHVSTRETSRRNADLIQVREKLGEFAKPQQGVSHRVEIMLEIRPSLERLLRELAEQGSSVDDHGGGPRRHGVVRQLNADIGRLVRARRSLHNLRAQLDDLRRPRYTLARRALRRKAEEISRQYRSYGGSLRIELPELLTRRRGQRDALAAVEREIQHLDDWLAAIHGKVYSPKFRRLATGDHPTDFGEERLYPILAETLAAGCEYLVRAYSVYRHALEDVGADPRLLDRVAGLAASIENAARLGSSSQRQPPAPAAPSSRSSLRPRVAPSPPSGPSGRRP